MVSENNPGDIQGTTHLLSLSFSSETPEVTVSFTKLFQPESPQSPCRAVRDESKDSEFQRVSDAGPS